MAIRQEEPAGCKSTQLYDLVKGELAKDGSIVLDLETRGLPDGN